MFPAADQTAPTIAGYVVQDSEVRWTRIGCLPSLCVFCILYRATVQHSTEESPYYIAGTLSYQLKLPCIPSTRYIDDYKTQMLQTLSDAWKLAQDNVNKVQQMQHDKKVGDRVLCTCQPSEPDQHISLPGITKGHTI